ncbi:hypothetical protein Pth03_82720 [Planotetraspora thailandica]|uniref:Ketopantoate reductase C-terminal domain-containing protein n=1 Tax=Planotetraspora thailandica TaxID=487172 RepID=A0A8J3Y2T2_9ACTN|nr:hypothetical protein Pth03_82720 [Planotetraspora thailandica]
MRFLRDAMAEAVRVGRARGIRLPAAYAGQQIEFIDTLPELMTSSMLNDGRCLEAMERALHTRAPTEALQATTLPRHKPCRSV